MRYAPTGAGNAMMRMMGVFHAVFGSVFAILGLELTFIGPILVGLLFAAVGAFFAINGIMLALGKKGVMGRSYQIESEEEFGPEPPNMPPVETHDHIPSTALDAKRRLEQLESLKSAGLITDKEFQQKRQEILNGL